MIYFDASAIVRLIRAEQWSDDLEAYLGDLDPRLTFATSAVGIVEVHRVLLRDEADAVTTRRAASVLALFDRVELSAAVVEEAARLSGRYLGPLDAIHLASALILVDALTVLLSYDRRMIDSAQQAGLTVAAPGMLPSRSRHAASAGCDRPGSGAPSD